MWLLLMPPVGGLGRPAGGDQQKGKAMQYTIRSGGSRRTLVRGALVGMLCISSSGCTYFTHYKDRAAFDESSYSLDAKQRVVFSFAREDQDQLGRTSRYVCAEPSPDALSAIAASGALEAQVAGQGGGAASASLNEAVAAIGLRTQTIQLLRDGLYRACEAYLNGAIDEFGYALLLNKYDETMVSLVAIDGLTGMRPAAQVAIGGETSGKASGEQNASTADAKGEGGGGEVAEDATPAATITIKDDAESSAKITTLQFSTPAAPNLDATNLAAISPEITKIVNAFSKGSSTTLGACMMWLARQEEDDLKKPQAQMLLDYCQWRRDALDHQFSPVGACLTWLASGENPEDAVRGKLCGEILRNGAPAPIFPAGKDLTQVAAK
jgi:hypothetical protein